jgi:hypothetical protein
MIAALTVLIAAVTVAVAAIAADAAAAVGTAYLPGDAPPAPRLHMRAALPAAHRGGNGTSGTSGTSGTCAGQDASGGFRPTIRVPEPQEPAEPAAGVPLLLTAAETDVLLAALDDAAAYRREGAEGYCADCLREDGGLCDDHADDLGSAGEYEGLAARLAATAGDGAR